MSTTEQMQGLSIQRIPAESPLVDAMGGCSRLEVKVHEHGFLALVDAMPRMVPQGQTADCAVVQAARVSYGQGTKQVNEDRGLIRYLLRHRHTTPFEMVEFKFHVSMPIFVARQWIRHRTASVNEYSARYSILPDRFYVPKPDAIRKQSRSNRQGGEEVFNVTARGNEEVSGKGGTEDAGATEELRTAEEFLEYLRDVEAFYTRYLSLAERGVSRELARIGLPVNMYTQWYWKSNLHNILRFLSLRLDSHAQAEIRIYAAAMELLLADLVPMTIEAWRDYEFESMRLTRLEVEAIRRWRAGGELILESSNKREQAEWSEKLASLNLTNAKL